jgi:hypothetical protein
MAKSKRYNTDDVFKNLMTISDNEENENNIDSDKEKNHKINSGERYVQRAYYLPERLVKAITLKTAESDLDKSGVVREALKQYLADILEKM